MGRIVAAGWNGPKFGTAMADTFSKLERSRVMAAVRSVDTRPEMIVRKLVYSLGYRYRLHVRSLPGFPDIVLAARRKIIKVHGCFWHRHHCKAGRSTPASRRAYWAAEFERNQRRDEFVAVQLVKHDLPTPSPTLKDHAHLAPSIARKSSKTGGQKTDGGGRVTKLAHRSRPRSSTGAIPRPYATDDNLPPLAGSAKRQDPERRAVYARSSHGLASGRSQRYN